MRRDDDVLLTVAEAADLLSINPSTVWRYIDAGELTPARSKKPYVLWQSDVVALQPTAGKRKRGPKPRKRRPDTPTDPRP